MYVGNMASATGQRYRKAALILTGFFRLTVQRELWQPSFYTPIWGLLVVRPVAHTSSAIEVDRALTAEEVALVRWLLAHSEADNAAYLEQLKLARVRRLCPCGCASIDFSVAGKVPPRGGMDVRSDFQWRSAAGHLNGAFVFAQGGLLAGLDLWSIDGGETPDTLPPINALVRYGSAQA